MFAQRLAGHSVASIARELNDLGLPCPSRVDPGRNRHRSGDGWTLRTVAAILANPRYTGRQVWNRQRTDHDPPDIDGVASTGPVQRWNTIEQWVISRRLAHPPLVSEEDFVAVQAVNAVPAPRDGANRAYLLTGLLICRLCGRRLDAHWVHGRAGYRCRHGRNSARRSAAACQIRTVYVREDGVLAHVADQLRATSEWADSLADPRQLVAHLWNHHMTITCGPTQVGDQHHGGATSDSTGPVRRLTPHQTTWSGQQ